MRLNALEMELARRRTAEYHFLNAALEEALSFNPFLSCLSSEREPPTWEEQFGGPSATCIRIRGPLKNDGVASVGGKEEVG